MPEKTRQAKPKEKTVWGAYKPDIERSYPDPPVRGRIVDGRRGKEFRPDPDQIDRRHRVEYDIRYWITGTNYDLVVQAMREAADQAIQDMRAGIARLQRFIDNN